MSDPKELEDVSQNKYPTFSQNLNAYFSKYTDSASVHGSKYVGNRKRSIIERAFWLVIIIISLYFTASMIIRIYVKWNSSPVTITYTQSPTHIGNIPFPAITVCSTTKAKQTSFNFTYYYHLYQQSENMTDEELHQFEDVSLLCDPHLHNEGRPITDLNVVDYYEKVAPTFTETLWVCLWQSQNETCDILFNPILTEEGICYTFNILDRDEIFTDEVYHNKEYQKVELDLNGWDLEEGYKDSEDIYSFPRRAMTAGAKSGLTILIKSFVQHQDFICRGPVQGFKISLHNPGEIPRVGSQFFRVPLNQEIIVAIKPDMTTTSSGLKDYDPHRRGCFFAKERPLRYFKEYTQQNCDIECQTNITYDLCGCVSFYMPHAENTPICGSGSNKCVTNAELKMVSDTSGNSPCDCLPACTTLTYNVETSQAEFNWKDMLIAFNADPDEFPGIQMTRLRFLFKERQFITSERNELYGMIDFLADVGGLLGLFVGISLVSLVELFYFLTLRLWVNLAKYGRNYWSGSEELLENKSYTHPNRHNKGIYNSLNCVKAN